MRNDKTIAELQGALDRQNALVTRLSKDIQRELKVIEVLVAAGVLSRDKVDQARALVDSLSE